MSFCKDFSKALFFRIVFIIINIIFKKIKIPKKNTIKPKKIKKTLKKIIYQKIENKDTIF